MRRLLPLLAIAVLALAPASADAAKVRKGPSGNAFYTPPSPLPGKKHGDLIWARKLTGSGALKGASANWLVLYRSTLSDGKPTAVSGIVSLPRRKAPKSGWKSVSWEHGTTGIADVCAPSRSFGLTSPEVLSTWLKKGYAIAGTDYQGLGTPGTHRYLSGVDEGRSGLDILRAARQLDPRVGKSFAIAGHSQGGHAALWAAALAPKWTPELDLEGTIAYAPASHIETQARILIGLSARTPGLTALSALIFRGIDAAHPSLHLSNLLTPQAAALYPQTLTQCLGKLSQQNEFGSLSPAELFRAGAALEPAFQLLGQSDPEHLKIHAPLFIAQGAADNTVIPGFTDQLDSALAAAGTKIDYKKYAGVDHGGIVTAAHQDTLAWARALLR